MRVRAAPSAAYDDWPYTRGGAVDRADVGALVQSAVDGDAAAWKALVEGLSPLVWSVVGAPPHTQPHPHHPKQTQIIT
jgi:hypothetical protein